MIFIEAKACSNSTTLFPYTTLFRSFKSSAPALRKNWAKDSTSENFTTPCLKTVRYLDRKSTRLNSSHANISYAVFCLKKKKLNRVQSGLETYGLFSNLTHDF